MNRPPFSAKLVDSTGALTRSWVEWFTNLYSIQSQDSHALTRPITNLYVGKFHFDETLGKPIWVQSLSPTVWCDATGAAV